MTERESPLELHCDRDRTSTQFRHKRCRAVYVARFGALPLEDGGSAHAEPSPTSLAYRPEG